MCPKRMRPQPFGKYVLLEYIGAGGMGEVVLAKAGAPGFERYFALKRILTESDASMTNMLISEAKLSISLVHPNIAQVFEFGKVGDHFFLAMEYIEGVSLAALLGAASRKKVVFHPADAIFSVVQVCRALHYAHEKRDTAGDHLGVVHRDVSPQNILIDSSGLVKLIDFGVAKAASNLDQTGAGFIKGKVGYMSPEQARGEPIIDRRADIYAVGIVLYESLTLKRCFGDEDPLRVLMRVQNNELPSFDDVLDGNAPRTLITALERSLGATPDDRYPTIGEMERDLAQALSEIDPAYTAHDLAELVRRIDTDRDSRAERFRSYSKISPAELLEEAAAGAGGQDDEEDLDDIDISIEEPPPRWSRAPMVLLVLALLGGAAGAAWWFRPWEKALAPTPPVPQPQPVATRTVLVESEPIAARVFVNGELRGLTPATITGLTAGQAHEIRFEKEGYQPETKTVKAEGDPTVSLQVTLEPVAGTERPAPPDKGKRPKPPPKAGTGCLAVLAAPWAYVNLNGKRIGTTPQKCIKLPPGKYTLTLTNPALGFEKDVRVKVRSGKTTTIKERLQ